MKKPENKELLGLTAQQLSAIVEAFGEPAYRGRQLADALYRQRVDSLHRVSTLPHSLRSRLATGFQVGLPQVQKRFVSSDGTVRYLLGFGDAQTVETVWMPEGDSGEQGDGSDAGDEEQAHAADSHWTRATICVSSQAGCAVQCQFCMTALLGLQRNLGAGEIVGQVLCVLNNHHVDLANERVNLVFMGQGEPFLNYENFMTAVRLLVDEVGIAASRMTVSTAGIVPRIVDFGQEPVRPKLAISLNASNEPQRTEIMPITRKWTLDRLLAAAREFPLRPRERLTFEYVLLHEVNDSAENARAVVDLLRGIRAKVNLIALNPGPEIPFRTPTEARVHAFRQILIKAGIPTFLRRPRGLDIYAACGQLKRTELVELPS